ncbi:MAG: agmatine deiminase family protein [Deltaproteobacteria bacterium]|nr:agmatine deiminase family protein [Deltaproteobacteria bacterium]
MRASSLLGLAAGVLAGLGVAAALGRFAPAPAPETLRAVPDSGGRLRALLVHWAPDGGGLLLPTYRDLLAALPEDVELRVAVERRGHFEELRRRLEQAGAAGLDRLRPLVVGRAITIWSRDRFVTAALGRKAVLVAPAQTCTAAAGRANDWIVPWELAARPWTRTAAVAAPFAFDGGDFVADERRIFATAVLAGRNAGTRWADADALRSELSARFGLEPLLLGATADDVPNHHIGMFVTPLGNDTVAVGDPREAAALVAAAAPGGALAALDVDLSPETTAKFVRVADELRAAGLKVVPLPLVPTRRTYVFLSYNNVLLDDRADGRHVLLPQYGFPEADAAGRAAWESLGFIVHPIDAAGLYANGGALRCVAAVLRRS